jgi:hypothetical protein
MTNSSGWAKDAGSQDHACGTHAPPFCGSGSPAPRRARFGDVKEPPDHSYKTLTTSAPRRLAPRNHPAIPYLAKRPAPVSAVVARRRRRGTRGERASRRRAASLSANKPGPHRRPAARHDAAPETFPRTTPSTLVLAVLGRGSEADDALSTADERGGGLSRPGSPLEPGRSAASPPLSPRESPRLPGVFHPRRASRRQAPAPRRRHAGAIRRQRAASSPRCVRRCIATPAGTPSSRKPGLGRLLRLSLPLSRPASCRRRGAYLSLSSETVARQGRGSCTPSPRPSDRSAAPRQDAC